MDVKHYLWVLLFRHSQKSAKFDKNTFYGAKLLLKTFKQTFMLQMHI